VLLRTLLSRAREPSGEAVLDGGATAQVRAARSLPLPGGETRQSAQSECPQGLIAANDRELDTVAWFRARALVQ
jgi:hypothetical protein